MILFQKAVLLAVSVFLLNLPFGAWRVRVPNRSLRWFLAIHLPIPFLFWMRTWLGMDARWILLSLAFAITAQYLGGRWFAPGS
ncbi:MAG: hypothetical protein QF492_00725 [Candidatus Krumholzibacteria bacterium]|jgi:hypothetical protein|nr:hypothetical protein [Candidatus Krumholzibacteria bacterium]MDP6668416.1 hypothetical protein [Candidatus Krumholzibacteria bacterium]MDP6797985.1 hypothetical protein [Candidatus Krumholzibacteria bacterium]MDP7021860.1 hypothetical protein [Candidatus Krumholzibacteria bacterium]